MTVPGLLRYESHGVTLLGDPACPSGVTLAFSERGGGCSSGDFASLNLSTDCGDDPDAVEGNRERLMSALGAPDLLDRLVNPLQVHGDHIVVVGSSDANEVARCRDEARAGADGIVCTAPGVPVLLCFADCVPLILVQDGGFAVVHSGWKGTLARIAAKATRVLSGQTGAPAGETLVYIGPHIAGEDYEVSPELAERFVGEFGPSVLVGERNLDLVSAIACSLVDVGVARESILDCAISTPRATDRFYSYRAEHAACGRHGAIAFISKEGASATSGGDLT